MNTRSESGKILYICRPVFLYLIVSAAVSASMEALWSGGLCDWCTTGVGAALSYALRSAWSLLCIVIPAGAGCLSIRGDVRQAFSRRKPGAWPVSMQQRALPVLLVAAVCLSMGINLLCALLAENDLPSAAGAGTVPGAEGFVLQVFVFGVYMPYIEETLFRGILFKRIRAVLQDDEAAVSKNRKPMIGPAGAAALLSSAAFGLYHGAVLQGFYAFAMGLLFAAAYARTGRLSVPSALHGACNLCVLLLQWTDTFYRFCTPPWILTFFALAGGGFFTIHQMKKHTRKKT